MIRKRTKKKLSCSYEKWLMKRHKRGKFDHVCVLYKKINCTKYTLVKAGR